MTEKRNFDAARTDKLCRFARRKLATLSVAEDVAEPALERAAEDRPDRTLLEPLDQLGEEALDHEPLWRPRPSDTRERR